MTCPLLLQKSSPSVKLTMQQSSLAYWLKWPEFADSTVNLAACAPSGSVCGQRRHHYFAWSSNLFHPKALRSSDRCGAIGAKLSGAPLVPALGAAALTNNELRVSDNDIPFRVTSGSGHGYCQSIRIVFVGQLASACQ